MPGLSGLDSRAPEDHEEVTIFVRTLCLALLPVAVDPRNFSRVVRRSMLLMMAPGRRLLMKRDAHGATRDGGKTVARGI